MITSTGTPLSRAAFATVSETVSNRARDFGRWVRTDREIRAVDAGRQLTVIFCLKITKNGVSKTVSKSSV
jgi:hypothetical protein